MLDARRERVSHAKGCRTWRPRGGVVVALRGRCEAATAAATAAAVGRRGATMRRFETTGALTEWSGSVEKCECRGGNVAPPGIRAEANLPHWLLIGGGRHGRLSHVPCRGWQS